MLPTLKNNAAAGYQGPVKIELLKSENRSTEFQVSQRTWGGGGGREGGLNEEGDLLSISTKTCADFSQPGRPFHNRWFALSPCWWTKQKKICSHSLHKNSN